MLRNWTFGLLREMFLSARSEEEEEEEIMVMAG
jgi:hypothetical protein